MSGEKSAVSEWPMAMFLSVVALSIAGCVVGSLWVLAR